MLPHGWGRCHEHVLEAVVAGIREVDPAREQGVDVDAHVLASDLVAIGYGIGRKLRAAGVDARTRGATPGKSGDQQERKKNSR